MSQNRTFICPRCLMANRHSEELNDMASIAYSMPQDVYQKLHGSLEKHHVDLAQEVAEQQNLIRCITWNDIEECLQEQASEGTVLRGTYILTSEWLKKNAARFKLSAEHLNKLKDMVLYQGELHFAYDDMGSYRFPVNIHNADETVLSDERRCANCGRLLSPDTGRADELRILLQGSSRAGKTSCIFAIINILLKNNHQVRRGFRAELTTGGSGAADAERYHNWLQQEVDYYRRGIKVEKTPTAQKEPAVYSLYVKIDDRDVVLTFVDMPGEYFDHVTEESKASEDQLLKQYAPIYKNCHFIWTCLRYETVVKERPTKEIWEKLEKDTDLTRDLAVYTEYENYRKRLSDLTREFRRRHFTMPHHAVILTMTDIITSVYNPSEEEKEFMRRCFIIPDTDDRKHTLLSQSQNGRNQETRMLFQERRCYNMCHGVSNYIRSINDNLYNLFEDFSGETRYFAMAAYGHRAATRPVAAAASKSEAKKAATPNPSQANAENKPKEEKGSAPQPFQAGAAFLWSLAVGGYLPIQYTVRYKRKLSWLGGLFRGNRVAPAGDRLEICDHFANADEATRINLLQNRSQYTDHSATLRRGETL